MIEKYDHKSIERKWQKHWEENHTYDVADHADGKENEYVLIEFPYPSGTGLHLGHCRSYTAIDAYARKERLAGKNVLFPFGTDAFGLEAERTAIREHRLPQEIVKRNIETFHSQLKELGLSFDWSRTINSCDEDYYKWTQWQFIQFFKKGLAEKQETLVNWCPNCGVLANEEVEDGTCCQCHSEVQQKAKAQWVLKMTKYGERLADDLAKTEYLDHIKLSQLNWIGKSEGVEVDFDIDVGGKFSIFTTCIETIFGITFMVLAPENKLVDELKDKITNWSEVEKYRNETLKKSEFDRTEMNKEKTGCKLEGIKAINPVNGNKVDIFISDFVLASYGTGAVMAVPTHDQRDFEFAEKFSIPKIQVIDGGDTSERAFEKADYLGKGCRLINSGEFTGQTVEEAKKNITESLVSRHIARKKLNFKMRDWIFSRQRYWGEPIPMINCPKCGWVPEKDENLPVRLPKVESYEPTKDGESPLSVIDEFVNCTCPVCGGKAKRETDTMPGWAGSSWYFLRYCDPHNSKEFVSKEALKAWLPVDLYNGGNEHTTRHLLYARFWVKVLYDLGLVPVDEPFRKRISQGIILGADGKKMSKSAGNGIDPRIMVDRYGADSLRLWMSFIGDYSEKATWSEEGLKACNKLLNRIWNMQEFLTENNNPELGFVLNQTIKKVASDIDDTKFNTAISSIMIFVNEAYKIQKVSREEYKKLLIVISPFAPHFANELFEKLGFGDLEAEHWPEVDEKALILDEIELPVQINGKVRGVLSVPAEATESEILDRAKANPEISKFITGNVVKTIFVPKRIINIIVK